MLIMEKQKGFTLIELVIVIIILGILASIAVPRYLNLSTDAENAAKLGMESSVKSAFALALGEKKTAPTITDLNDYLSGENTTAVGTGIQYILNAKTYIVQTYTDNKCTTATTSATTEEVQCVGATVQTA
jgi:type IV pilus assembly protein PilA